MYLSSYLSIYLSICLERLWGIGSCDYQSREDPRSATCRLETQESWIKGLRSRGANGVNFKPSRDSEMRSPSSVSEAGKNKANYSFLPLFVLFRPSTDWMMPTHTGEDNLLSPLIQMLMSSRNVVDHTQKCLVWASTASQVDT